MAAWQTWHEHHAAFDDAQADEDQLAFAFGPNLASPRSRKKLMRIYANDPPDTVGEPRGSGPRFLLTAGASVPAEC